MLADAHVGPLPFLTSTCCWSFVFVFVIVIVFVIVFVFVFVFAFIYVIAFVFVFAFALFSEAREDNDAGDTARRSGTGAGGGHSCLR